MRAGLLMLSCLLICACTNDSVYMDAPQKNDIYIFEENQVYFPILVDSVAGEKIYCVNSAFKFVDAIPELEELPKRDFDFSFQLVYEKAELKRLYQSGNIVKIYRP
jgi:phage regulator Rha-like protein